MENTRDLLKQYEAQCETVENESEAKANCCTNSDSGCECCSYLCTLACCEILCNN